MSLVIGWYLVEIGNFDDFEKIVFCLQLREEFLLHFLSF